jgi:hypothetical protein
MSHPGSPPITIDRTFKLSSKLFLPSTINCVSSKFCTPSIASFPIYAIQKNVVVQDKIKILNLIKNKGFLDEVCETTTTNHFNSTL